MMDPELKARWIAVLRSGEYSQGTGKLKSKDGYCCLGVLCMLKEPRMINRYGFADAELGNYATIEEWIGHDTADLYQMNDSGCRSFVEIADWIEKNL
jgi:hypothetical protein